MTFTVGDTFSISPPEVKEKRLPCGIIRHLIWPGPDQKVVGTGEVAISARKRAPVLVLSSGAQVVVLDKKREVSVGDAVVLDRNTGDGPKWLRHQLLEKAEKLIAEKEFAGLAARAASSWRDSFRFHAEEVAANGDIRPGLRPPQIGALHAIGAHWSLLKDTATVVMPTGTGKTEAMLATLVALVRGTLLVVVPTRALRDQTARKFLTLGLLRRLENLVPGAENPVVGVLNKRPSSMADMKMFKQCNVVVATIGTIAQGTAEGLLKEVAKNVDYLIIDEAHHVAAETWTGLRDAFAGKPVLQFTATPFRRDGKPIDGKLIYSYPLHRAQADGYFKTIHFKPVFELDESEGDRAIAAATVAQLEADLAAGFDHIAMARCADIKRAEKVFELYEELAEKHRPLLIHSEAAQTTSLLNQLRQRESRIVVCVNMLGEGFDLPQLKIAGVHDTHKSLAVLLQFTGRFTRSAGDRLGDATVIANIANQQVSDALERLYDEDADWNKLLREQSSNAAKEHAALVAFLDKSKRFDEGGDDSTTVATSPKNLLPKFSAVTYRCDTFQPKRFHDGLAKGVALQRVWLNEDSNVLFFVTRVDPRVEWSRSRLLRDRAWHLYVVYHNPAQNVLFIHSTDRESLHEGLAKAVSDGKAEIISGDNVFRVLGRINRLVFQNIGLKKPGRRNLRFSMYSGADVAKALTGTERTSSTKSNVSGNGFAAGVPVTVGCSYKGRVWAKDNGTIQNFMAWCDDAGAKLIDAGISTEQIIDNVMIPREVEKVPDLQAFNIDWPDELLARSEESTHVTSRLGEFPLSQYSIELVGPSADLSELRFRIVHQTHQTEYALRLGGTLGFEVVPVTGEALAITVGRIHLPLREWFTNYPPSILFVNGSELDGNLLIEPRERKIAGIPVNNVEVWDWTGVDLTKESQWRDGAIHKGSIQFKASTEFQKGYDLVFDDDDSGEAADLVCITEDSDAINLALVHCKYSKATPGERVKDVVDVASQAVRSGTWIWRFAELCKHLVSRESRFRLGGRPTRFVKGDARKLNRLAKASRFKPIKARIVIVQPGLSKTNMTDDQSIVLGAAHAYLMETVDVELQVVSSA